MTQPSGITPEVAASGGGMVRGVVVAVPAHDEASTIAACIESIDRAASRCGLPVCVAIGADACGDDTVAVAGTVRLRHTSLRVIAARWRIVGAVRAAAVAAGTAELGLPDEALWIANTDADCVVSRDWLARQLDAARSGADAVAGVVALDARTTSPVLHGAFVASYGPTAPGHHRHVHGANLGVRAAAYRKVGGWSTHTMVGEEHRLWRRLGRAGSDRRSDGDLIVTTSSRTTSRVRGGFATRLRQLDRQIDEAVMTA